MDAGDEFRKYVDGIIKELEEQIAREEAALTEEERAAELEYHNKFCERMIQLIIDK